MAAGANQTLDQAISLGSLSTLHATRTTGTVVNPAGGGGGVDWYSFTLETPAVVALDLAPRGVNQPLNGVLSLYNNDAGDFLDPYDPSGYRLLAQATSGSGNGLFGSRASINQVLGPGTYEVAVSGAGDQSFYPFLAGSGLAGATGDFALNLAAIPLGASASIGPRVLSANPAAGSVLSASPFVIRLDLSAAIDPTTVLAGSNVQLIENPTGHFGNGNDQAVALAWTNVGVGNTEIQIAPAAPLGPGYYEVLVGGLPSQGQAPAIMGANGIPFGANAAHPQGQNFSETFRILPAADVPDDTPATAIGLGDLSTASGLVQVAGAIGNNAYYDGSSPALSPANQVNLYHFTISGPGRYGFLAEVFAGRIGSPLDPGVSLYERDPSTGQLVFLAGNNNTGDTSAATNGTIPLYFDAFVSQTLTAGDYYVAVADGINTPSPSEGNPPGTSGVYDPNTSLSATNGYSTGPYLLNLLVQSAQQAPQVVATSPSPGAVLAQAPGTLTVTFNEPVDVQQLGFLNFSATNYCTLPSIFIVGSDGTTYYPRIDGYDQATNQLSLEMLDRLPAGSYTLHLQGTGPWGVTDLMGDPLAGNDPSGDYVVPFQVTAASPMGPANVIQANPGADGSDDLGVLFPHELQAGITIDASGLGAGTIPSYQFTVLQGQIYFLSLGGSSLPDGETLVLENASGTANPQLPIGQGKLIFSNLAPGTYTLLVAGVPEGTSYQIRLSMTGNADNPVPLVTGPAPAIQLHFSSPSSGGSGSSLPNVPTQTASSGTDGLGPVSTGALGSAGGGGVGSLPVTVVIVPNNPGAVSSSEIGLGASNGSVAGLSTAVAGAYGAVGGVQNLVSSNIAILMPDPSAVHREAPRRRWPRRAWGRRLCR